VKNSRKICEDDEGGGAGARSSAARWYVAARSSKWRRAAEKPTGCLKLSVRWLASKDVAKRLPDEKNYNSG
jgi:hypothetical protein